MSEASAPPSVSSSFPIPGTPEGSQRRAEAEARSWGGLIRDLKIQLD